MHDRSKTAGTTLRYRLIDFFRKTDAYRLTPELEEHLRWSKDQIDRLQFSHLKRMLAHAYRTTAHYRKSFDEAGFDVETFCPDRFEEFCRIPILTKEQIREDPAAFISSEARQHRPRKMASGGTSGNPLIFQISAEAYSHGWADCYRQFRLAGWDFGVPMGVFRGSAINRLGELQNAAYRALNKWVFLDTLDEWDDQTFAAYHERIERHRLEFVFGYAASIAEFAFFLKRNSLRTDLRAALCTTEVLRPEWREVIGEVMSQSVFDFCQVSDGGFAMFECKRGRHHLSDDVAYVERTDSEREEEPVTVTSLHNHAMPFIRYQNGYLFRPSREPGCPCGCQFTLIDRLLGRRFEYFVLPSGAKLHGAKFGDTLRDFEYVKNYQVVQTSEDRIVIRLIEGVRTDDTRTAFWKGMDHLARQLSGLRLDFRIVDQIQKHSKNQKTVPFVSLDAYREDPEEYAVDDGRPADRVG
ncbi:MAG: hypothetical protein V2A76_16730 [Planctomycetota bacterium]